MSSRSYKKVTEDLVSQIKSLPKKEADRLLEMAQKELNQKNTAWKKSPEFKELSKLFLDIFDYDKEIKINVTVPIDILLHTYFVKNTVIDLEFDYSFSRYHNVDKVITNHEKIKKELKNIKKLESEYSKKFNKFVKDYCIEECELVDALYEDNSL